MASRPATVDDVHAAALAMPHVTVYPGTQGRPVYQVGGKSFVFFRNPRPDAVDPVDRRALLWATRPAPRTPTSTASPSR